MEPRRSPVTRASQRLGLSPVQGRWTTGLPKAPRTGLLQVVDQRLDLLSRTWLVNVLAGALYLGIAIAVTWPIVLHLQSWIFGPVPSDLTGGIGLLQEHLASDHSPFLPGRMHGINAPEGIPTWWARNLASFPSSFILWVLAMAVGPIAAVSLLALAAFTFTALSMFMLTRWLTDHTGVALIAGLAFGYWPYVFGHAWIAVGHGWVFVVLTWRALVELERPTLRNGLFTGLAAVLCMTWTQYWILIGGVFYVTLAGVLLLVAAARRETTRQLRTQVAAFSVIGALVVCLIGLASVAPPGDIPSRPKSDAYLYSARLPMYVLPDPGNPLFGGWSSSIIKDRYDGFTPDSPVYGKIYLGWTLLALALFGLGWLVRRLARDGVRALHERTVAAGLAGATTAMVALVFSGPPRVSVLGLEVPTPGELVLRLATAFRNSQLFALVVMVGICILAALGLRALLAGRSPGFGAAVVVTLAVAVPLDLWGPPPYGPSRLVYPRVYSELSPEPPGILAAYPFGARDNPAILYRPAHDKAIFNDLAGTDLDPVKGDLQALSDPGTVPRLAALGVRYVVVTPGASEPWQPRPVQSFRGLRVIDRTPSGTSFRVTARPVSGVVSAGTGFDFPERIPGRFMRWMIAPDAGITVQGRCNPCVGRVRITAASFARARLLTVRNEAGVLLKRTTIGTEPTSVSFPVRFRRHSSFDLHTRPGPESIAAVTGASDPRRVSIQIAVPMEFVSRPGG
jgi:hypothetical protein